MSGLGLGLVDPGLVDVHRVGPDAERPVQQDVLQSGTQRLPQDVLAASMTVKVDQHLDDGGVSCDHVLRLLHLQPDSSTQTLLIRRVRDVFISTFHWFLSQTVFICG